MTKKRFIKLVMSSGRQRNEAQEIAKDYNLQGVSYAEAFENFLALNRLGYAFEFLGKCSKAITATLVDCANAFNKFAELVCEATKQEHGKYNFD